MERVLCTGGAGFLGSYVVDALLARGCKVLVYDCLLPQVHPQSPEWPDYQPDHESLVKWNGDIRQYANGFREALSQFGPDTVIHLAAMVGVGQSACHPAAYTSCNVTGTVSVFDWISRHNAEQDELIDGIMLLDEPTADAEITVKPGETLDTARARVASEIAEARADLVKGVRPKVRQVFVAGSMSSYGEGPSFFNEHTVKRQSVATPETWELTPASVYAWTKAQSEEVALLLGRTRGLDVRVGRFFNAYGSRQALGNPYTGVAAIFFARAAAGLAPIVYEDGAQSRDFIHASDVATAVLAILDEGKAGEVYNVGTGVATSVLDLAHRIAAMTNIGDEVLFPIVTGTARVGDIRHCYADSSKLRALGWEPKITLAEGLEELRAWVASQPAEAEALLNRAHLELEKLGLVR